MRESRNGRARARVWLIAGMALGLEARGCSSDEAPAPKPDPVLPASVEIVRPLTPTEAARIPQSDPSFERVEIYSDALVFHYKGAPTIALAPGNVVAGNTDQGYLRRIKTVTTRPDGALEVATEPAQLVDLIQDGAFKIRQKPAPADWQEEDAWARPPPLWSKSEGKLQLMPPGTKSGFQCGGAAASTLDITPTLDSELDFELDVDIRGARLASALVAVNGSITGGLEIESGYSYSGSCTADVIKAYRAQTGLKDALKFELTPIRFFIGWLPIVITHGIEPIFTMQGSLAWTSPGIKTTKSTTYGLRTGVAYDGAQWQGIWEPSRTGTATMDRKGDSGTVSISSEIAVGVKYQALLYDVTGPKIGLQGAITGKYGAAECTWEVGAEAALQAVIGAELQIPVFDYTLADYTETFTLLKGQVSKAQGTFPGCEDSGVSLPDSGDAATDSGPGEACPTEDPALDDLASVAMALGEVLEPSCRRTEPATLVHSASSVVSAIGPKAVAHDHTTTARWLSLGTSWDSMRVSGLFNGAGAAFPCGAGANGHTLCAPSSTVPAGDFVLVSNVFEKPVPLADPSNYYQYGFVFDADGITTNNYTPGAAYPNDFFKDTDRWYTADYSPVTKTWSMKVVDARNGTTKTVTDSKARMILKGNTITLAVPASELGVAKPKLRLSAFRHGGDYGINPPYDFDGSLWRSVAEGLVPMP